MLKQDLNKLVNSYDLFNEARRSVTGLGIDNSIEIDSSTRLKEISIAADRPIRRSKTPDGKPVLKVEYRGIRFFHVVSAAEDAKVTAA